MNSDDQRPAPSFFLPLTLLAVSFAVLLIFQIVNISKQHTQMLDAKKQMISLISQREALVKQSGDLQAKLQAMAIDLLELAKTNDKAKEIIKKYNIQQQANPAVPAPTPGTAAPAASTPASGDAK